LIAKFARKGDAPTITRIAVAASRIQQLQEQIQHIEQEIPQIEEKLKTYETEHTAPPPQEPPPRPFAPSNGHTGRKRLRITVDWGRLGKPGGKEVICDQKCSETMTRWATRLYQQFGHEPLQKLARFRIGAGPMVSDNPQSDFRNRKGHRIYMHRPIADSGYYMLTHSSTLQKVNDVSRACHTALSFPIGAIVVEETEQNAW
jgi:hypothetical protein